MLPAVQRTDNHLAALEAAFPLLDWTSTPDGFFGYGDELRVHVVPTDGLWTARIEPRTGTSTHAIDEDPVSALIRCLTLARREMRDRHAREATAFHSAFGPILPG